MCRRAHVYARDGACRMRALYWRAWKCACIRIGVGGDDTGMHVNAHAFAPRAVGAMGAPAGMNANAATGVRTGGGVRGAYTGGSGKRE